MHVGAGDNAHLTFSTLGEYHDRWLKFEMDLPPEYACTEGGTPGCWWKVNYAYPSGVNDTTTWKATKMISCKYDDVVTGESAWG